MTATSVEHNFVDPVFSMKVAKGSKVPSFAFESETYHFCADSCRKAFIADPEKFQLGVGGRQRLATKKCKHLSLATETKTIETVTARESGQVVPDFEWL